MAGFTFSALTPTSYLDRAAHVFAERPAVVDGAVRLTYAELGQRSHRLAGALAGLGVQPWDRVAALCTNSHVMLEMHHGVPFAGAVLVPMDTHLPVRELSYLVEHSGAQVLVATGELTEVARQVAHAVPGVRLVLAGDLGDRAEDEYEYEPLLAAAEPLTVPCADERDLLAINYTSGTTGPPKGVMYHHRGAALQALAMAFHSRLTPGDRYLWTLPMSHCDGWCFPWAVTAAGATHVCLRAIDAGEIWRLIREEGITHLCAAPTVLAMIADGYEVAGGSLPERAVWVGTGAAPPSSALLTRMAELRMQVTHLYGLTETYGPVAGNVVAERLRVVAEDGADVPADAATLGELVVRGNDVMLGYYRDSDATAAATLGGWLRTGDRGVVHPDGHVEIRDHNSDVLVAGGERVAAVEIERVLGRVYGTGRSGHPEGMGFQVTEVQKTLKGFDYPGGPEDLAKHAEGNGADHDLVEALRGLDKDQFDGPNAVMQALGQEDELGGPTR